MNDEDDIIATKEAAKGAWLGRPGVTGMDIGFKYVGGKRTGEVAIRLFVRKKLADVPSAERFPGLLGKHKTDVIEREFTPLGPLPDTKFYDPMKGGVLITCGGWAQSTGMFVRDNVTGQLMILGTCHGEVAPGSPIFQPFNAPQPAGSLGQIGYLIRGGHYLEPPVDADLFSFAAPRGTAFEIEEIGCVKGVREARLQHLGMKVSKRGKSSGLTHGTLDGYQRSVGPYPPDYLGNSITYDNYLTFAVDPNGPDVFRDPGGVPVMGQPGDSGSIIVDSDNYAVAMTCVGTKGHMTELWGPSMPAILSALNVTPCFCGTILPRQIILSSTENPSPAPTTGNPWDDTQNTGDWGKSTSGERKVKPFPTCPVKSYKYTITNIYQSLQVRATVAGFTKPTFRWKLNTNQLNDFGTDGHGFVSFNTMVWRDASIPPGPASALEGVKLSYYAQHNASYDISGTYSFVGINPTAVQGHMILTVEVEVKDMDGTVSAPESTVVTLDTQHFQWDEAYYQDQARCTRNAAGIIGLERHPFTLIDLLLAQPNPPPEVENGARFVAQLSLELAQLAVTQPNAAKELTRIFAQTLNIPQGWLAADGAPG